MTLYTNIFDVPCRETIVHRYKLICSKYRNQLL